MKGLKQLNLWGMIYGMLFGWFAAACIAVVGWRLEARYPEPTTKP